MFRVGQNCIYTACIWFLWQGDHQIYGHIRCMYTILANPTHGANAVGVGIDQGSNEPVTKESREMREEIAC